MSFVKLHTPTNMAIYGPTQSGKTKFVLQLLKQANTMFTEHVDEIYYCYGAYQQAYEEIKTVAGVDKTVLYAGMPLVKDCVKWSYMKNHIIIVFDDLMTELGKDKDMVKFVTVNCSHNGITMIVLLHNIFQPGLRTLSINTHYVVLFKNKRDSLQVEMFGRRVMKDRLKYFFDCYRKATQNPYGYLFVDLHPRSDDMYVLRTRIFSDETPTIIYVYRE